MEYELPQRKRLLERRDLRLAPAAAILVTLALSAAVTLSAMRQLDGALSARHPAGFAGKGVLDLPPLGTDNREQVVRAAVNAWHAAPADPRFADGLTLAERVLDLDRVFILLYGAGLVLAALWVRRAPNLASGRRTVLWIAVGAGFALVLVDLLEDQFAREAIRAQWNDAAKGGASDGQLRRLAAATTLKLGLAGVAVVLFGAALYRPAAEPVRLVLQRTRIVVALLAALAALLLLGIGGEQSAEVIRAWDGEAAGIALGAVALLAAATALAAREMTRAPAWELVGERQRNPLPVLLGSGGALLAVGLAVSSMDGWSAALAVGGALLLLLAIGSVIVEAAQVPIRERATRPVLEQGNEAARAELEDTGRSHARVLAAGVLLLFALVALRASTFDLFGRSEALPASELGEPPIVFGAICAVAGILIVLIRAAPLDLSATMRWALGGLIAIVTAAGVVALFGWPLEVGRELGALPVVAIFFASVLVLVAASTRVGIYEGRRFHLPTLLRVLGLRRFPTVTFLALWFVLAGVLPFVDRGGYHDVRILGSATASSESSRTDPTLEGVWSRWLRENVERVPSTRKTRPAVPLVLIAASGGGLRAAAWTSLALDCLFERLPAAVPDPTCDWEGTVGAGRADRILVASGTSGGSLGLVEYDAALRTGELDSDWVTDHLEHDFVAPVVAGLLFRDLPRSLIGWDATDRATLLEEAWEEPWRQDGAALAAGLRSSWTAQPPTGERARPALLLNGTSVEDRCRFMTAVLKGNVESPARPTDNDCLRLDAFGPKAGDSGRPAGWLPATTELLDFLCSGQDVRMSTAALLSARFAFVSPSGRLTSSSCAPLRDRAVTFVIDGGYFDNSGAVAVLDLWRRLEPAIAATNRAARRTCIVPVFIQLDNDFEIEPAPGLDERPRELLIPPQVIAGGIGTHEAAARAEAAATFDHPSVLDETTVMAGGEPVEHFWMRVSPQAHPGPRPPLGWALSSDSFADMRAELNAPHNRAERKLLSRLFGDGLTCQPA